MDFKDWRKTAEQPEEEGRQRAAPGKYSGKRFEDYIGQQIREAMERGEFDNLPGAGKPLRFDEDVFAGDKAMGYHLLKNNGYAPNEIELAKEIRVEYERAEARLASLRRRRQNLHTRRVPPFASEKRTFNATLAKVASDYEQTLRDLNRKILTLNLTAPAPLHRTPFDVEKLLNEFRESCPPL